MHLTIAAALEIKVTLIKNVQLRPINPALHLRPLLDY